MQVVSQTPYRVSLAGGGTDLPAFYRQEPGAVLSTSINRYVTVTVKPSEKRAWFFRSEDVVCAADRFDGISHGIARECLRRFHLRTGPVTIFVSADFPKGSGMGGSGALCVGLLNALSAYAGAQLDTPCLAASACDIEINDLGQPVGKQDQWAAAVGGVNHFVFNSDDSVEIHPVALSSNARNALETHSLLLYTGSTRDAEGILRHQSAATPHHLMLTLRAMRDRVKDIKESLIEGKIDELGFWLDDTWHAKRSLGCGISNLHIDAMYETARAAGAMGGKLLGAGGNGFLYLLADPDRHQDIRHALGYPMEMAFGMESRGTRII